MGISERGVMVYTLNGKKLPVQIDTTPAQITPLVTYMKMSSSERYLNLIEVTGEEVAPSFMRYIYILQSISLASKAVIQVYAKAHTPLFSIVSIHRAAGWLERECWDMYGTLFIGHYDLRRIITDYGYRWHPLRKDFPLIGHIESFYDDLIKGITYVPVEMAQAFRDFNR